MTEHQFHMHITSRRTFWGLFISVLAGLAVTLAVFWEVRQTEIRNFRARFANDAAIRATLLIQELNECLHVVTSVHQFVEGAKDVDQHNFKTFTAPFLAERPGIQALAWISGMLQAERAEEADYQALYALPTGGNESSPVLDIRSEPNCQTAMKRARDTGNPTVSGRIGLAHTTAEQFGFVIFIPTYRVGMPTATVAQRQKAIAGFALGIFRIGDLLRGALEHTKPAGIDFEVLDHSAPAEQRLLHRWSSRLTQDDALKTCLVPVRPRYAQKFSFAGREWVLDFGAGKSFAGMNCPVAFWLILPAGLALTLFFSLYLRTILTQQERAALLVSERTAELRESTSRFQDAHQRLSFHIDRMPLAYIVWDAEFRATEWNPAAERIFGWPAREALGRHACDLIVPRGAQPNADVFWKEILKGNAASCPANENVRKDGTRLICEWHNTLLHSPAGEISGCLSMVQDITERKRAEEALRESEEHGRLIFEQTSNALVLFRIHTHNFIDANPAALQLFGVTREELAGLKPEDFIPPQVFHDFISKIQLDDHSQEFILEKANCYRKDRSTVFVSIRGKILNLKNEYIIFCSIRDITEKVRLQEEIRATQAKLIHTNKMTSLGMLVSSIAHEINNPTQYISVNALMLADVWRDAAPILKRFREESGEFSLGGLPSGEMQELVPRLFAGITEGAGRISTIIKDMRDFVREDKSGLRGISDINGLVRNATSILWHHIHKHTENFSVELEDGLPTVRGNSQQLEQVIINLIMNALQALPDKTSAVSVTSRLGEDSGEVIVTVRDEGKGMDESVLERLKEPFFSTKIAEGGTGLGLYISDSIVKEHNGAMEFESAPGKGTTVILRLPFADELPAVVSLPGQE